MRNSLHLNWKAVLTTSIAFTMFTLGTVGAVNTQIHTDNTLSGITALNINAPGASQMYTLSEINGKLSGHNLFYSFSDFSIGATDTAWFNLNTPELANVISRVTGGIESVINGQLKMANTASGAPSFFFINPAGMTMSAGASVDVPGSFYASTASKLNFSDGSQYAANETSASFLSSAKPESFGFLGNEVGSLTLSGTEAAKINLNFKPGSEVALVANQITITNAGIFNKDVAQAGLNLQIITIGEEDTNIKLNTPPSQATAGNLTLQNAFLTSSGSGSGNLLIRAGDVSTVGSYFVSDNYGEATIPVDQGIDLQVHSLRAEQTYIATKAKAGGGAGNVSVNADTEIQMSEGYIGSFNTKNTQGQTGVVTINTGKLDLNGNAFIATNASGGDARSVNVTANSITLNNKGSINSFSYENATGNGGTVTINTDLLKIDNSSSISTGTSSDMKAGDVFVNADSIQLTNSGSIQSSSLANGMGGGVTINTHELEVSNNSYISVSGSGKESATGLAVTADNLRLSNGGGIYVSSLPDGKFDLGIISIKAGKLEIDNGGIESFTGSKHNAANIIVQTDLLKLSNGGDIYSGSGGTATGNAGEIKIETRKLEMDDGKIGVQTISSEGNAGKIIVNAGSIVSKDGYFSASSAGDGKGNAGSIEITADTIEMNNTRFTTFTMNKGNAGNITVIADNLVIGNESSINSDSFSDGYAGNVEIIANSLVINGKGNISSDANTTTEFKGTKGNAGNVTITADQLELDNGKIRSTTLGQGDAGDVKITAGFLNLSNRGAISSNVAFLPGYDLPPPTGDGGDVIINARNVDISNGLILSNTQGEGNAGSIVITTDTLESTGNSEISSSSGSIKHKIDAKGDAGSVSIEARRLDIRDTNIASESIGSRGNAGQVTVNAGSLVLRENGFISTSTFGSGHAGDVSVTVDSLTAYGTGNTNIDLSSNKLTGIFSAASSESSGQTGNIDLKVGNNVQLNNGALISIASFASAVNPNVKAGQIHISSKDGSLYSLYLDSSVISTETAGGQGGALNISNSDNIFLRNSQITTSVKGESGNGGDINIASNHLIMDTGFIQANTEAPAASGGNVNIKTSALIPSASSLFVGGNTPFQFQPFSGLNVIQAAAPGGESGAISSATPQLNLSGMMTNLVVQSFDSNALNRNMCSVDEGSFLLQSGKGGLRMRARDFLLSPMY